ncbi:MAG: acetyl-CoA carboxylase carboxyl transferase subunit beta, partial [Ruminococcus sp.]|nr:acetyl-CoA carboxylase carboxyl transferase subunit beta [Ruminococcus sp.]
MFDDFFNVVKLRFNGGDEDEKPSFKCPRCQSPIPMDKYEELHRVCPNCNYHGRLPASERIAITVDRGTFTELDAEMVSGDPIDFP